MKTPSFLAAAFLLLFFSFKNQAQTIKPGKIWPDNNGVHINAHGGGMLIHNGKYYWFGEHKTEGRRGNAAWVGVHCYSSENLTDWKDEGIALEVSDDPESPIVEGCVLERPKVIYNEKTGKFVLWFHLELKGQGYTAAKTGVAVADNVTGPYTFLEALNPNAGHWPANYPGELKNKTFSDDLESWSEEWLQAVKDGLFVHRDFEKGQMSRDMTLYIDNDGTAYHIHAAEENLTLHISELNEDYTGFTGKYIRVLPTGHNEAPSIFKRNGKYYMITSGCTGWDPNAARLLVSDAVMGEWQYVENPCVGEDADITFDSQSTYVFPVQGEEDAFIFMADRWRPQNAIDGRYVWLPVQFKENGMPYLEWMDEWSLGFFE
ncbi:Glycosyl hydrolases family 43 [Tangfeifania diversioriginum]|uniref:Glycosyl hydrolases family 43 n=1 Tax=Tangfeifania diversioriginum TaxID=1168035 RepID=A0A1M6F2V3_9BACT|nr:glycoside hydrolase family 43 protein [Tangfeifania diversioriginum]SHI91995.1 Glycosyl hydrolases family 43 [Tangfeifania diversioriginum]